MEVDSDPGHLPEVCPLCYQLGLKTLKWVPGLGILVLGSGRSRG